MPYGMERNENNEWYVFNREYVPLGWNDTSLSKQDLKSQIPIHTKYKGLTDNFILKIVEDTPNAIKRNEQGNINRVFFYDDGTNPSIQKEEWDRYFKILKKLSSLINNEMTHILK